MTTIYAQVIKKKGGRKALKKLANRLTELGLVKKNRNGKIKKR